LAPRRSRLIPCKLVAMDHEIDRALDGIGSRLRAIRQERQLTLADLATETGISESTLSRLESGRRRPNLDLLLPVARALRVSLDEIVNAPATGDPRVDIRPYEAWGRTIVPLSNRADGMQAFKQVVPAAASPEEPTLRHHEGYEWVYVIDGRLRLIVGEVDIVLQPGEAAEFDTRQPHWSGSADGSAVEYLCLFNKQGERVHLRAGFRSRRAPG
jgi:transcriptional regulator with XRE-family HTH domain